MTFVLFAVGVALLIGGAEMLVRGASRMATAARISPLVIGLTVVAFGTSAPELAVSFSAAVSDQASIAVGNVIGSNIFNVLLILGISAIIAPLVVSQQLIRIDVPLMIGVSVLVLAFGWDGRFSRLDGAILFGGLVAYTVVLLHLGRRNTVAPNEMSVADTPSETSSKADSSWIRNLILVIAGLLLLVAGSRLLVASAVEIAQLLGVSDLVIGLTIIAAGTSLPEVVTSIIASLRGERDLAVGNVVGSNLFNMMGVLGLAAVVAPGGIDVAPSVVSFDIPIMIAVAFACLPIFFTGGVISRWEGALLFAYYIAYTTYLILAATDHDALVAFGAIMLEFVIPITAVTLVVLSMLAIRRRAGKPVDGGAPREVD